ncbi:MAG: RHS repeat-associated core domain-containing protein, partial [Thermoanaerobaculia bacterium]
SWKIRDLGGRVLREFLNAPVNGVANWSWKEDWIWRGSVLLGAVTPQGNRHFDVDHLGSVRLITDDGKNVLSRHQYWAYGEEASSGSQDAEVMKFAGQERDFGTYNPDGVDYMHARYYDNRLSRFTTMDPLGGSPGAPQSWNRYGYVLGSPVTLVDPYGWAPASGSSGGSSNGNPEDCREDGHGNVICGGEITVTANNPFYRGTFFWDRGWDHGIFSAKGRANFGERIRHEYLLASARRGDEFASALLGMNPQGLDEDYFAELLIVSPLVGWVQGLGDSATIASSREWWRPVEGEVRVSRWMSPEEAAEMRATGSLQVGAEGRTYVTSFGAPQPGGTGPLRVDFNIPRAALQVSGRSDWFQVVFPARPPINGIIFH